MPIPGTKGQGEEILKYMNPQKKSKYDESFQNDESSRETPGGGEQTSVTCPGAERPVNTKEDKHNILDANLMNARAHLLCLILNKKKSSIDDQMNAIAYTIYMHPDLCKLKFGELEWLPLHIAVKRGFSLAVIELLISIYPEALLKQDTYGRTPLNLSLDINRCEADFLRLLACPEVMSINDKYGNSVLHKYCQCEDIDIHVFREFVNSNPNSLGQTNTSMRTPLHVLIDSVSDEMDYDLFEPLLEFLLVKYPVAVEKKDAEGYTPLHIACRDFNQEDENFGVIQLMVQACPKAVRVVDTGGNTPLHFLIKNSNRWNLLTSAGLLLSNANVLNYDHSTPLHLYCSKVTDYEDIPFLRLLIEHYALALQHKDAMGNTPLALASRHGSMEVIEFLFEKCPKVLEPVNQGSTGTPLHTLCAFRSRWRDFLDCLRVLTISKQAVVTRDYAGRNPFHWLCFKGGVTPDALEIFVEKFPHMLLERNVQGRIPLHLAIEGSVSVGARSFPNAEDQYHGTIKCLLDLFPGAVRAGDKWGMTPLQLACENDAPLTIIYQLVIENPVANLGLEEPRPIPCKETK